MKIVDARVHRLPGPGETLAASGLARHPGGEGADQALVAAVGTDPAAGKALALLSAGGVDLTAVRRVPDLPTGHALITVDDDGETTIVVAAGANAEPVVSRAGAQPSLPTAAEPEAVLCSR